MTDTAGGLTENIIDCIEALGGARPQSKGLSELYQALAVALSTGGGGGAVASVSNEDGTITINPTTGIVVVSASASLLASIAAKAPLASPALTGNPTAPTQAHTDDSTRIATTQYVTTAIVDSTTGVASFNGLTGAVKLLPRQSVATATSVNLTANTAQPISTASNAVTAHLPDAPADLTLCFVKIVAQNASVPVTSQLLTVATQGSDVINVAGGATSFAMAQLFDGALLQYDSSTQSSL
jgi:hypothetical protein